LSHNLVSLGKHPRFDVVIGDNAFMSEDPLPKDGPGTRGTTTADIVRTAKDAYLHGQAIDMSSLATDLGLSRATLYRRVGNHEQLLGLVLAGSTEETFHRVLAETADEPGRSKILTVAERFMRAVVAAKPLRRLIERDPVLFVKVVMAPGHVEDKAIRLFAELLDEEITTGRLHFDVPTDAVAQAIVRIGDSFMYSHLLGQGEPQLDQAVTVIGLILKSGQSGHAGPT
jgi:AcrR family transcriptional regulator